LSFFRSNSKSKDDQYHQKSWSDNLPYKVRFRHSQLYISALLPIGVGLLGGFLVSILGIGAGFLLVPAMIYILRMPPILVAGTYLFQIIFSSIFATYFHAVYNQTLDLILALILLSGGVVGAQLGVRVSVYIKGSFARILLATLILSVGLKLGSDLLIEPSYLFKVEGY
jgi:uncharacterized membrane protein YfcA